MTNEPGSDAGVVKRKAQMNPATENRVIAANAPAKFSYAIATVLGIGYLKPGPGTWGSLVGLIVAIVSHPFTWFLVFDRALIFGTGKDAPLLSGPLGMLVLLVPSVAVWLLLAYLGVQTSGQVAAFTGTKDPQFVVIDEVSGVHLALILGLAPLMAPATFLSNADAQIFALYTGMSMLNWKYLLAGFVLFRLFDIAKPFPCRRLEKLPGGWGIMADDWMAGVYAAICLRIALHFHLLNF
jgi:phosphatidylglycerophosphatase A